MRRPAINDANRRWWILGAASAGIAMAMLDETVVAVALDTIRDDLGMSQIASHWIVNAYLLTLAAFVALGGRIADIIGRRTIFLVGIVVFVAASACSGASHIFESGEMLIAARAAQGLGAAMMIPSSQAIVTSAFPVSQRGTAMGVYAGISVAFLALGPLLGGVLTEHVGWEWV
ncbi:MAG: MFS transporter, partial [Solirubrobacterales bacterium]